MLPCKAAIKELCKEKKHLQHNIFDLFNWTFQLFQTDEVFIRNGHNQTQTQSDFIYHDRMTHCNWPEAKMRLKNTALFFAIRVVALLPIATWKSNLLSPSSWFDSGKSSKISWTLYPMNELSWWKEINFTVFGQWNSVDLRRIPFIYGGFHGY